MLNYELYHYGVKGMKWGQRKPKVYANIGARNNIYITNGPAGKQIRKAGNDAYKKAIRDTIDKAGGPKATIGNKDRHIYVTDRKTGKAARAAGKEAYKNAVNSTANKIKAEQKAEQKSKKERMNSVKSTIKKTMNSRVARLSAANSFDHGVSAAQAILKGDVGGAMYHTKRAKDYEDARKWWADL